MAAPKGMWECPVCGDYMPDSQKACTHCNCEKTEEREPLKYLKNDPQNHADGQTGAPPRKRLNFGYTERNIGSTLKTLARSSLVLWIVISFILACIATHYLGFWSFLLVLVCGCLIGALVYVVEYAFGCMVESSIVTAENSKWCVAYLDAIRDSSAAAADNSAQCVQKLEQLLLTQKRDDSDEQAP